MSEKDKTASFPTQSSDFNSMIPRTIISEANPDMLNKRASTGISTDSLSYSAGAGGFGSSDVYRNPSRRFYDPEVTTTSIYLPKTDKIRNRWNRWFYNHDEMIGAVLDLHAELPYSRAEILVDDPSIKNHCLQCMDNVSFFANLPAIDLEYMKIGEVIIHTPWDEKKGMWEDIIIHNPDFIDMKYTPFAGEASIELKPDDELKHIIYSTSIEDQQLKKRLPKDILRRVLSGRNIILDPDEVTHIARKSSPYDERGTSILQRLYRTLMFEDKLRESQITIADTFIYPLKLFKLGDPQKGWIPPEAHQRALAQMLQQAKFDPDFALIYHYGLSVEYITAADKVMKLDSEWNEINKRKMIALGVNQQFLESGSTYSSANVGLQIQLARYKAKRDLFELKWIQSKFFKVMARRLGWYHRDKREILGQFRVKRTGSDLEERLIVPRLMWHKKLMMRDDQSYLNFLNNVYAQGKGPISAITLLMGMGLDLEEELRNKSRQKALEDRSGEYIHEPQPLKQGIIKEDKNWLNKIRKGSKKERDSINADTLIKEHLDKDAASEVPSDDFFTGAAELIDKKAEPILKPEVVNRRELELDINTTKDVNMVDDISWHKNLASPNVPEGVVLLLTNLIQSLRNSVKKSGTIKSGILECKEELTNIYKDIYVQGKLKSYEYTDFLPVYKSVYAKSDSLMDYSDVINVNQFSDWIDTILNIEGITDEKMVRGIRNIGNSCFAIGQVKGYKEQGINNIRISNVISSDGVVYKTDDLLSKGWNLSSVVSPEGDIIILNACIEGYDDEDFGNTLDPNIKRHGDFSVGGITVTNCPVEYTPFVKSFIKKLGSKFKKKYSNFEFVKDVIDLPEWEELYKEKLKADLELKESSMELTNKVLYDKTQKRGKVATLCKGRKLYISNWIGCQSSVITDNLIKYIELDKDSLTKNINKYAKDFNYNLSVEELNTYKSLGIIDPIKLDDFHVTGWKISSAGIQDESTDIKLKTGMMWDLSGSCIKKVEDPTDIYFNNLKLYIDYTHKLDKNILNLYRG